jgi:four helix bundle protein
MKIRGFEDLNVFQRARELTNRIYEVTRDGTFSRDFRLVNQITGASVSVMSNIAEGFERGTNAEFVQFLYIAKGSSAEFVLSFLWRTTSDISQKLITMI